MRKINSAPGGQIFAVTKSKNSAYCRVPLQSFALSTTFSLPRIKLVLK